MAEFTRQGGEAQKDRESPYPGWKVVLAGFFGVLVSFAATLPYTFGLFLKPLAASFGWHRKAISTGFSKEQPALITPEAPLLHLLNNFAR